jgi:tRNA pseudouridine55 synthase
VGHAGTLDPFAEGVLPVCIGQATRVIQYLMDASKAYRATVRLGVETDTYDLTGAVVAERDASLVTRAEVDAALPAFVGDIEQVPPAYSALKRDGVPMYKLARAGRQVELHARPVRIHAIEVVGYAPPLLTLDIECGKGTYIRSLAHDLGAVLGVGASLDALVRTRVGHFRINRAVDMDTLRAEFATEAWRERLLPPDEVLLDWPAAILGEGTERRARNGLPLTLEELRTPPRAEARAYTEGGDFLGVLRRESPGAWRPAKIFAP